MSIKMSRFLLAVFAVLAIFAVSTTGGKICPPNEVWNDCGSACPPTCKNPSPICTLQCVPRCQCALNLIKNDWGRCIKPENCRPRTEQITHPGN